MCYKYKLHEYKHKKEEFQDKHKKDEEITWSMQICPNDDANGKVSDYLSNVLFINNNDNKDRYYIDDTHFYYVGHGNSGPEIELCFKSGNYQSFDELTIVTQTEYCIRHESNKDNNNYDFLCSKRSVSVTDICGLDSIGRNNLYFPSASIDYIPQPGQLYKLGVVICFVCGCDPFFFVRYLVDLFFAKQKGWDNNHQTAF